MDPHARSRDLFSFQRPETLREMVQEEKALRGWLRAMPKLPTMGLGPGRTPQALLPLVARRATLSRVRPRACHGLG